MRKATFIPNVLFDFHLPNLSVAELKILLLVCRQTIGWKNPRTDSSEPRKRTDWLSASQLMRRTNCSRRAICSAIGTLVEKRLIDVLDDSGYALDTPHKRKGRQQLFYRPSHPFLDGDKPVEKPVEKETTCAEIAEELRIARIELAQKMLCTK